VDPADYTYINSSEKGKNIGFLSRLCKENGLDILVDAFILLKKIPGNESSKLLLTGGQTSDDTHFIKEQKEKISYAGLTGYVDFIDDFSTGNRTDIFNQVTVLSVPVRQGEAFGIYLTEAMAAGIPVVQPPLGAFPEIIEKSGGGIIYPENTPESLASILNELLGNPQKLQKLSSQARSSIEGSFNINHLAAEMNNIYSEVINFRLNNIQK
jgi:glycosyltransferase involved in cell wall biosynthesis